MSQPLFDWRVRARHRNLAGLSLLALAALPYGAAFLALALLPELERGPAGLLMTAGALLLSGGLPGALQGRIALLGNRRLRYTLGRRLGPEAEGEFVGFAAGAELRSWEGETDQDIGFLALEPQALVYRGDQFKWSLRREALDDIRLQAAEGDLARPLGPLRVLVRWHGAREPARALTLASRATDTLPQANEATRALAARLRAWSQAAAGEEPDQAPLPGPPPSDTQGGALLHQAAPGSCLSALAIGVIAFTLTWHQVTALAPAGRYARGLLGAGLVTTSAVIFTAHFLTYLQAYQARQAPPAGE